MSHHEVRGGMLTLIFSGPETTANVMTWARCYLRDRDELWEALVSEAASVLPLDGTLDVRAILYAPTAKAVMAETLRLAPPAWVARTCS